MYIELLCFIIFGGRDNISLMIGTTSNVSAAEVLSTLEGLKVSEPYAFFERCNMQRCFISDRDTIYIELAKYYCRRTVNSVKQATNTDWFVYVYLFMELIIHFELFHWEDCRKQRGSMLCRLRHWWVLRSLRFNPNLLSTAWPKLAPWVWAPVVLRPFEEVKGQRWAKFSRESVALPS